MTISLYLSGGIGNQLFNYAAARSLADRNHADLVIDLSSYRAPWSLSRPFMLDYFPIRARLRNRDGIIERHPLLSRIIRYIHEDFGAKKIDREKNRISYFDTFHDIGSRAILNGEYISYKFFQWNEANIRNDLEIDSNLFKYVPHFGIFSDARCENSVGIHVRRGDLLTADHSWMLMRNQREYYIKSIKLMGDLINHPKFFVVSDDIFWCENAFKETGFDIRYVNVDLNARDQSFFDFCLLTQCQHHIIANSAFSWWAAWLSNQCGQMVICPDRWDPENILDLDDIAPRHWLRVAA